MTGFDNRILRVGVEIGKELVTFEGLAIEVSATKTSAVTANDATIKISNINKTHRDHILTETSPWNKLGVRKRVIVQAGRDSYGSSTIFIGDIISATVQQPPDIAITLKARTNNWNKTLVTSKSYGNLISCKRIAQGIADDMGLALVFEATDKQIASYAFTGAKSQQLDQLGQVGRVNAYIDDDKLIVVDIGKPLKSAGGTSNILDLDSGMVGIPELTEQGIKVKMMFEPHSKCGGLIQVRSRINPGANGKYIIYQMDYDLANRSENFYNTINAYKQGRYLT